MSADSAVSFQTLTPLAPNLARAHSANAAELLIVKRRANIDQTPAKFYIAFWLLLTSEGSCRRRPHPLHFLAADSRVGCVRQHLSPTLL